MGLLTDQEIKSINGDGDATYSGDIAFARAIEAAVLARLATVSVEPCAVRHSFDGYGYLYGDSGSGSLWYERAMAEPDAEPIYSPGALAAARVQENERVTALIEKYSRANEENDNVVSMLEHLKSAIRALLCPQI